MMRIWIKRITIFAGIVTFLLVLASSYCLIFGAGRSLYLPYASRLAVKVKAFDTAESYAKCMFGAGLDVTINHNLSWKTFMGPRRPATVAEATFIGIWTMIVALGTLISTNRKKQKQ